MSKPGFISVTLRDLDKEVWEQFKVAAKFAEHRSAVAQMREMISQFVDDNYEIVEENYDPDVILNDE